MPGYSINIIKPRRSISRFDVSSVFAVITIGTMSVVAMSVYIVYVQVETLMAAHTMKLCGGRICHCVVLNGMK